MKEVESWKGILEAEAEEKEELSNAVIAFLKEKVEGLTFEKAENILSETIRVLRRISERRLI